MFDVQSENKNLESQILLKKEQFESLAKVKVKHLLQEVGPHFYIVFLVERLMINTKRKSKAWKL